MVVIPLAPALVPLVAAFGGAFFAFKLEEKTQIRKERATSLVSGNLAMFTLVRQWNVLVNIQTDEIEDYRNDPAKFITMIPRVGGNYENYGFDYNNLSFLIGTNHVNCLNDLSIAENRFNSIMQGYDIRTKLHIQAQDKLSKVGIAGITDSMIPRVREELGDNLAIRLDTLTEDLIKQVDEAVKQIEMTRDKLGKALKELYHKPNESVVTFERLN
jgi:hypothetical protein